ncbi:cytochrome c and c1 heme-lyase [Atractiella rhizophila]|nr:cytochrome c and c1 heme-lyase [Atractiella rhizophila]
MWPFTSTPAPDSPPAQSPTPSPAPATASSCPVPHHLRSSYDHPLFHPPTDTPAAHPPQASGQSERGSDKGRDWRDTLSKERVVSSIPRSSLSVPSSEARFSHSHPSTSSASASDSNTAPEEGGAGAGEANWVYPSPHQFYTSLVSKHPPSYTRTVPPETAESIVQIHNAVNEKVWREILKWERMVGSTAGASAGEDVQGGGGGGGGGVEGQVKLVSFRGRAGDMTPRARWRSWIGYAPPFDRHDWIIERPLPPPSPTPSPSLSPQETTPTTTTMTTDDRKPAQIRYVIDFYKGRGSDLAFFLDVRPALDGWEGVRMRWERWRGAGAKRGVEREEGGAV